jgi:STE24 endopeptidase
MERNHGSSASIQAEPLPSAELDAERQGQAKRYARMKRYLMLADLAVGALYMIAALATGFSAWLKGWVGGVSSSPWWVVGAYMLVFFAVYSFLILPLNILGGYVWPHRFGLSRQSLRAWAWDHVKGLLLGAVLGLIFIEIIYWLMRAAPVTWWLWASLFYLFFTVILSNLAPLIIVPLFFKLQPLDNPELVDRLMGLAKKAGTQVKGVYKMDLSAKTSEANAALMGLGNTRRIVLGDTMLTDYSPEEIETVLAHELGHQVHGDIHKGIALATGVTLGGLWLASLAMSWAVGLFRFDGVADVASLPVLMILLGIFGLVTMPLTNGYSRWRERLADGYALEMTGKSQAFASAMTRLANQNLAEAEPERWVEVLLYDHPAIHRRVAMAHEFKPRQ